jgi:predicted ribonucleotide reductase-associated flavodoxin
MVRELRTAVVYATMSGNTKEVAEIIAEEVDAVLVPMSASPPDLSGYDLLFIGTYTWGYGETPHIVKDFARALGYKPAHVAVFGTGDTQWPDFCAAADRLAKFYESYFPTLKIEQSPRGCQESKVAEWTREVIACYSELKS